MPTLDRITIYPVKSLDGVDLTETLVLPSGALENDRRWQLTDIDGRVLNAKRSPLFHAIRSELDLAARLVTLSIDPLALQARAIPGVERLASLAADTFPLVPGPDGPCAWLAEALSAGVRLEPVAAAGASSQASASVLLLERAEGGFPDDREAPGPTVVSTASLEEIARWFGFDLVEARRRFRANLEIGGCDAFWEDTIASPARENLPALLDLPPDLPADPYADLPPLEPREFTIGEARFRATNVCRRCVVPSRDSRTGAVTTGFRDAFEARRGRGMRADVDPGAWGTLYRLGVNTQLDSAASLAQGQVITVG
jgi:uncharacterized protein YcbX